MDIYTDGLLYKLGKDPTLLDEVLADVKHQVDALGWVPDQFKSKWWMSSVCERMKQDGSGWRNQKGPQIPDMHLSVMWDSGWVNGEQRGPAKYLVMRGGANGGRDIHIEEWERSGNELPWFNKNLLAFFSPYGCVASYHITVTDELTVKEAILTYVEELMNREGLWYSRDEVPVHIRDVIQAINRERGLQQAPLDHDVAMVSGLRRGETNRIFAVRTTDVADAKAKVRLAAGWLSEELEPVPGNDTRIWLKVVL